jgi:hypothetical protein
MFGLCPSDIRIASDSMTFAESQTLKNKSASEEADLFFISTGKF